MKRILIPDLSATQEVDILEETLKQDVDLWDAKIREAKTQEEQDEADAAHNDAIEDLDAYRQEPDPNALITIGYIPASKITELDFRWVEAAQGQKDLGPYNAELGIKFMNVCREYVRAGVKGWSAMEKFDIDKAMDYFERNNWLYTLTNLVKDFNSLSEEKKTESSPKPGMNPESTTVSCAEVNPTFSEQEDATSPAQ